MAFGNAFDNLNYGSVSSLMGSAGNYDPTQFNAVGESLSQTPLANGAPISNDYSNDNRDAMDYKKQLRQANQDTANVYDDGQNDDDHILLNDGTKMKKVDDSHIATGMEAAAGFLDGYLAYMNKDVGQAISSGSYEAGQFVSSHEDKIKRQNMIKDLDNKTDSFGNPLYNSIDLMKWRDTGDTKDLIANQGKWLSDGNGWMHNDLTGQSRYIGGYDQTAAKPQQLHYLKNPDGTYTAVNPFTNQQAGTVGQANPTFAGGSLDTDTTGDDGTGESDNKGYTFNNGQWTKPHYNSKGQQTGFDVAGPQQTKQLNEQQAAKQPSATENLVNSDIATLQNASPDDLDYFTGKKTVLMNPEQVKNFNTIRGVGQSVKDTENAADRIDGYMQNQGVGAAKAMGLSGINTLEEAKRAFASMPRLDRSSPEAFQASLQKINSYVTNYNSQNRTAQGVTQPSKSGGDFSHLW